MSHLDTKDTIDILQRQGLTFDISSRLTLTAGVDGGTNDEIVLGDAGYTFTGFRTGSKPVLFFSRKISYDDVGVIAYIYRDPTFVGGTPGGTILDDFRNDNDINPSASQVIMNTGLIADGSVGSISDIGDETFKRQFVFGNTSNQGSGDFIETLDRALLAKPNTQYILVFKNISESGVQVVGSHLSWAEPDHIPGLIIQNGEFVAYNGAKL